MNVDDRVYQVALSKIPGVGAKLGKQLIAYCGSVQQIFSESKRILLRIPNIGEQLADEVAKTDPKAIADHDLNYCTKNNVNISFFLDEDYPTRFKHMADAPLLIYSKGSFDPHHARTVAIVGTRKPSNYGQQLCATLVEDLKAFNVQIISGLAYGIDGIAHKTAVKEGIENLAVMGTGMDVIYPAAHKNLSDEVMKNGALITEYPTNMRTDWENFPRRNRVIAAMADVVIVVQSAKKGGSLITAEFGNQYFKDVFAFPGRINDDASAGCNALIKQNKAHLMESVDDIAYIMRWSQKPSSSDKQATLFIELTPQEQVIFDLLKAKEEATMDWLHNTSKITLSELSSILLTLEFKGVVQPLPGKQFTLT